MTETIRPMDELRECRDTLCENLAAEVDLRSMIGDVHSEIDNELAEANHGAVEQEVGRVAAALMAIDPDVRELAGLAAVRLPGDPEPQPSAGAPTIPDEPDVVDPATVRRMEVDDVWSEFDVEQRYEDDLRDAWELVLINRSWHVRHLVDHAADLIGSIVDTALAGDDEGLNPLLSQRDELVVRLASAVTAWELAVVGRMDVEGDTEHVALVQRWLDDAR